MNPEEAKARIDKIRAARAAKGGRMANVERDEIAALEKIIAEEEPMSEDTTEPTEEVPEAPTPPEGMVNVKVTADNVCVPVRGDFMEITRLAHKGEDVTVPKQFLEEHGDKVEAI